MATAEDRLKQVLSPLITKVSKKTTDQGEVLELVKNREVFTIPFQSTQSNSDTNTLA